MTNVCKHCKNKYIDHLYISLDWEYMGDVNESDCNRFIPMDNLEMLEWRYAQSKTRNS